VASRSRTGGQSPQPIGHKLRLARTLAVIDLSLRGALASDLLWWAASAIPSCWRSRHLAAGSLPRIDLSAARGRLWVWGGGLGQPPGAEIGFAQLNPAAGWGANALRGGAGAARLQATRWAYIGAAWALVVGCSACCGPGCGQAFRCWEPLVGAAGWEPRWGS